jgi:hypothetical protein
MNGATQEGREGVVSHQNLHIMERCCGRRELIKPSTRLHLFQVKPIQIAAFLVLVSAHLMWVRLRSKSTRLPNEEISRPGLGLALM